MKRKKYFFLKIVIAFFLLFVTFGAFLVFKSSFFNIKEIEVASNLSCVSGMQIRNSAQILGKNIFFTDSKNLEKNVKNKFVCVKSVTLIKLFPSKVKIELSGRVPVAILASLKNPEASVSASIENIATPSAQNLSDSYLIDEEAVFFAKSSGELNIPSIFTYDMDLSLGKKFDESYIKISLKILDKIKSFGLSVRLAAILDKFLVVYPDGLGPKIIFRLDEKGDAQIASLQLILKTARIDSKELEFIDLRFDKPIVRFTPKKNG